VKLIITLSLMSHQVTSVTLPHETESHLLQEEVNKV